jgi:alginate O-acetyltransferase complex protein AlgI
MLFNSFEFIFGFLPACLFGYQLLGRWLKDARALWLLAASMFFYGWWNPSSLWILALSIFFNHRAGALILFYRRDSPRSARWVLVSGLVGNVLLLGTFKYADFVMANIDLISGTSITPLGLTLPIGISFFTFTQIAYLVDVWRQSAPNYPLSQYALFVSYFPHLIAGPILHHSQMMPQFDRLRSNDIRPDRLASGCLYFVFGLAKKVLIADSFAEYATLVFNSAHDGNSLLFGTAWLGSLAYTFQLYFDFSGYCDMAIGMSLMLGIDLPQNFNSPYKSRNIIEFWRTWHMTLSAFLRAYIYIPLGGNRHGSLRRYLNLMTTMLIGGLWHGANWTFVFWGGLHAAYLIINHLWISLKADPLATKLLQLIPRGLGSFFARSLTFLAVVVGWVFFRADTFSAALDVLAGMCGLNGVSMPKSMAAGPLAKFFEESNFTLDGLFADIQIDDGRYAVALLALGFLLICMPNTSQWVQVMSSPETIDDRWFNPKIGLPLGVLTGLLFLTCVVYLNTNSEFLYFKF